ncbi:MAG: NAD(P)H-quinone oxidoreductase [Hamadaea sp.]|uniref:NAD(P)H-quinone oxidoreductase n=1 Tax=Hamadaea sp. TaxID=2024425 RepID=UPI001817FAFC|nr:NAD(P)H-quinone oxidoreductase [Hamadaea sp.]NUT24110.1 NAD(P)H-quinone oxidoreductase [Hamadaea sp.]
MRAMSGDLVWREVPDPEPGPGEVLVKVAATAVNRADLLQVQGLYPPPPGAPAYLGLECSGTLAGGTEVCALLAGGGYAEFVAVPEGQILPKPRGLSLIEAATLPEVACTVWSNLTMVGRLAPGETVLIHGGGSGIGTFAIQYAKALGARVIATARREKHEKLRELGADELLDYREDDFSRVQADVVLDIIGGAYLGKNVTALTTGGRLVIIGLQGGRRAELDLGALVSKRLTVAGTTLRSRPVVEKAAIVSAVRREVWPMLEDGRIRPVVDMTFPVEEAAKAHERVAANAHLGKVVLAVSAP